ncbi:MAG: glycerophosphodiester phosphodiesterase family protein, partial [Acidobacteriota bacterium]
ASERPPKAVARPGALERSRGAGRPVVGWTANAEKTWAALVEAGVDAIITDDPAGLIAWMKGRGLR